MAYQYQNNTPGRTYTEWNSNRGSSNKQLQAIPPITNTANGKRYYSSIDAELYFGDIFIDEITSVIWNVQQQTLPIYGYNSYTFDDVAVGSRIVSGQFSVNFTEKNFLNKIQNSTSFKKIARRMYGEDISVADSNSGKIYSDFRQRLHLPLWDKGFDIVIGLGDDPKKAMSYSTFTVLSCVQVTGSTMQLDFNGDPIQETYTFMAREIKETFSDDKESNPVSITSGNLTKSLGQNEDLKLTGYIDLKTNKLFVSSYSSITFKEGSDLLLTGDLKDKNLSLALSLTPDKNTLIKNLDINFISSLKKERGDRDNIMAIVNCNYVDNSNKDQNKKVQTNVNLSIKK